MKLLIIVLGILIERYGNLGTSFRQFDWLESWDRTLQSRLVGYHPAVVLACTLLPILIGVESVFFLFGSVFWGGVDFVLEAGLFFFCLGPHAIFNYAQIEEEGENPERYFREANRACFGLIYAYLIFGVMGMISYRLLDRLSVQARAHSFVVSVMDYLDWVPVRLTAILYLLVGNLQPAFPFLRAQGWISPEKNAYFLTECSAYAMKQGGDEGENLSRAEQLVWHALVLLLVCLAMLTLAAWI